MKIYNIIVSGPAKAGRAALLKNFSDHVFSSPEQVTMGKRGSTYSVDFGRAQVDDNTFFYLAGVPVGEQFDFLWERLADGLLGMIVVFNAKTKTGLPETIELIGRLNKLTDMPYVVIFSDIIGRDDPNARDLKKKLGIPREDQIIYGSAKDKDIVKGALTKLLNIGSKIQKKVIA